MKNKKQNKYPKTKIKPTVLQPSWLDDSNIINSIMNYIGEERLIEWLIYDSNIKIEKINEDIKYISSTEHSPYFNKQELKSDLNSTKEELKRENARIKKLTEYLKLIK